MKLYLIHVNMQMPNDTVSFDLTLEGDDPSDDEGDWSATGSGAPFLVAMDGTWSLFTVPEGQLGAGQGIALDDGKSVWNPKTRSLLNPFGVHFVNSVAFLDLPRKVTFPLDREASGAGSAWPSGADVYAFRLSWKVVQRIT